MAGSHAERLCDRGRHCLACCIPDQQAADGLTRESHGDYRVRLAASVRHVGTPNAEERPRGR